MSTRAASTFFAVLALACLAGAVVVGIVTVRRSRALVSVQISALQLAALVAVVATLGSLYYSEVADFVPCRLCWFQRIFMYPLAVILPIAAVRRDVGVRVYALPLAVVGLGISIWHYLVQHLDSLSEGGGCDITAPCSLIEVERFGFVTIPFMAGCGFLAIAALLAATLRAGPTTAADHTGPAAQKPERIRA